LVFKWLYFNVHLYGYSSKYGVVQYVPVRRNISAGLKIAPRRISARNKFAAGDFISGENPPGEKIMSPLEIKSPPEQLEYRFNKSPNVDMQKS